MDNLGRGASKRLADMFQEQQIEKDNKNTSIPLQGKYMLLLFEI